MKTKLIFSTETKSTEQWTDLPFIPRFNEWINTADLLKKEEIIPLWQSANHWSGIHGIVKSVEYRYDAQGFYTEILIWCEDEDWLCPVMRIIANLFLWLRKVCMTATTW